MMPYLPENDGNHYIVGAWEGGGRVAVGGADKRGRVCGV